jgi:hypothetical protein
MYTLSAERKTTMRRKTVEDWIMIRVPRELRDKLEELGLRFAKPGYKWQGNHEDIHRTGPALWHVIRELLERDLRHKQRADKSKSSSKAKRRDKGDTAKTADLPGQLTLEDFGVYTES